MGIPQRKNETGESPEAALIRRIKEDLNIDVMIEKLTAACYS